jgi:hypothetical protein
MKNKCQKVEGGSLKKEQACKKTTRERFGYADLNEVLKKDGPAER